MVLNKVSKKEAEIASSAEYLWKDSGFSIVNQTNLTVRLQVFRERRTHTLRKIVWKKKAWASDEVTSPSSLFNRVLCSRECDRSALKTYLWHQSIPNFMLFMFSDVNADFSDVEVFFSDVNAIFSDVNLKKSDWDLTEEWKAGYLTSNTVYFAL